MDEDYQKALREFQEYKARREREKRDRHLPTKEELEQQRKDNLEKEFEKEYSDAKKRAEAFRKAQLLVREANDLLGIVIPSLPVGNSVPPPCPNEEEQKAEAKRRFDQEHSDEANYRKAHQHFQEHKRQSKPKEHFQKRRRQPATVREDSYSILGLNEKDHPSLRDIKLRFISLAQKHHPDKGGDPKIYMAIYEAYEHLTHS